MQTRKLGNSELNLTVIGFGTWAIGGGDWAYGWGAQDDKQSVAAIQKAVELGINWIDTAAIYGLGHAEKIVGEAVRACSTKPLIATKCGLTWNSKKKIKPRLKKESVTAEVEDSLKRLDLDTIDLYQIHWPNPEPEIEEAWETIARLIEQGKIRYAGVSNFNVEQLKRAQKIHPVTSLQPPYSMIKRKIEKEVLPYCSEQNIGIVAYSPMQKGILTDKFTREFVDHLPSDDHRVYDNEFKEPRLSLNIHLVEQLKNIAKNYEASVAQLALAWVLVHPEITSAIVGTRKPEQIEDTVKAEELKISPEDLKQIDAFLNKKA